MIYFFTNLEIRGPKCLKSADSQLEASEKICVTFREVQGLCGDISQCFGHGSEGDRNVTS